MVRKLDYGDMNHPLEKCDGKRVGEAWLLLQKSAESCRLGRDTASPFSKCSCRTMQGEARASRPQWKRSVLILAVWKQNNNMWELARWLQSMRQHRENPEAPSPLSFSTFRRRSLVCRDPRPCRVGSIIEDKISQISCQTF